jgi:hypothetical protein
MSENDAPDVLPVWANQALILLWLLLLGGRWVVAPLLQLAGLLAPQQLGALDEAVLLKLYLALLVVTCAVAALRAVRGTQSNTPVPGAAGHHVANLGPEAAPTAEPSAGGDEALD